MIFSDTTWGMELKIVMNDHWQAANQVLLLFGPIENPLWPLAAILDNRSEQKVTTIDQPCQEYFCQVWFQSIQWFLRRSLFYIFPIGSLC
jgi:hypothetical protein